MISSKDRSGWFGASDTDFIVGNWETKTFLNWWLTKLAIHENTFESIEMNAGTHKEHQILNFVGCDTFDRQIIIPEFLLRVNLDGEKKGIIYECKTFKSEKDFKIPLKYKRQIWVQQFATKTKLSHLIAYGLNAEDYENYFLPIDKNRLLDFEIQINESFLSEYLPKLKYLSFCLKKGKIPLHSEFLRGDYNV